MKKKKKKTAGKITVEDYIKAIKKADRDEELSLSAGWKCITSVHKNKKLYNRKTQRKNFTEE
ncbi:hypothetical protein [Dysgonomonas gadei]|uniref:Uncharacterized protein n=1 Tax=Dysgonomonas gadei ATCC BAA-286 TaxID=742766 RepID=F5J0L0_9BACT|nr:hypothetical protein [Dysgonomonas gadei]EGK00603.1 hypothetical protein HMPREF9455_02877 [Dysgonomonas gadei ATCC BAA-286]